MQPSSAYTAVKDAATVRFLGPWRSELGTVVIQPELGYVFINLHNSGTYLNGRGGGGGGGFGGGGGGRGNAAAGRGEVAPTVGAAGASGPPGGAGAAGAVGEGGAAGRGGAAGAPAGRAGGADNPAPAGGQRGRGRGRGAVGEQFAYPLPSGQMAPCYAPPYGALVAVDANRGKSPGRRRWASTRLAELGDVGLKTGIAQSAAASPPPAASCSSARPTITGSAPSTRDRS